MWEQRTPDPRFLGDVFADPNEEVFVTYVGEMLI